jgi:hypothetical protein
MDIFVEANSDMRPEEGVFSNQRSPTAVQAGGDGSGLCKKNQTLTGSLCAERDAAGWLRYGYRPQVDHHLEFMTAIFARPEMMDFPIVHVMRSLRCDHQLIALTARQSVGRAIGDPGGGHDPPPLLFGFFMAWEDKSIVTIPPSTLLNDALPQE